MNSGLMDMLRYDRSSAAKHWRPEFGSATASEAEVDALFALAPYNNVRFGVYPAALILVGDGDDIVVPWHSYKFAAALQHAQTGDAPILLQVEHNAGHGAHKVGKGKDWWIDGIALRMGFLVKALKIEDSRWQKLSV
jgi:prolyl oligopeptidase